MRFDSDRKLIYIPLNKNKEEIPVPIKEKESVPWDEPVSQKQEEKENPVLKQESDQENESTALWKKIQDAIKKKNPMVYFLTREGKALSVENDVLKVVFPTGAESKKTMLSAPVNMKIIQECVDEVQANLSVVFLLEELNEKEQKLKDLFGSALIIEDN